MWFWKKRKPAETEEKSPDSSSERVPRMGYMYRPPQLRDEKTPEPGDPGADDTSHTSPDISVLMGDAAEGDWPAPDDRPAGNEDGPEGTSRAARAVSPRMEPTHTPRAAKSFDPSKASPSILIPLQSVSIATPCRADWSKMEGDSKSRFCQTCQKSVYNLSAMTTPEAQALLAEKQGDLCARIYRRSDGTVITSDCPVGKTAPRRPFWGVGLAAIAGALLSGCSSNASRSPSSAGLVGSMRDVPVLGALVNMISPQPAMMGDIAMTPPATGKIACPAPTATPAPTAAPTAAPTQEPDGAPEMGEAAASYPMLGRIALPQPTSLPQPTEAPAPTATTNPNA